MVTATRLHASAVALAGNGLLIRGASGSGKSSLALQLISLGATLIADDQTLVTARDGGLWLSAPDTIRGLIEARGVGLLHAETTEAQLHAVANLDRDEAARLPTVHCIDILGHSVPCLHKVASPAWPAALVQYLRAGRREP